MNILPKILVLFYFVPSIYCLIPCPLVWERYNGETILPEDIVGPVVPTSSSEFAARVWSHEMERYYGARMTGDFQAFYYLNGVSKSTKNFEYLSNPHGCFIKWVDSEEDFLVPVDENGFIGRALVEHSMLYGHVQGGQLYLSTGPDTTAVLSKYQRLQSYSYGMRLELKHFTLLNENVHGREDVLGQDEIYNNAETELRQWVRFSKKITEYTTITSMHSWSRLSIARVSLDFGVNLGGISVPIGGTSFVVGFEEGEFKNSSFTYGSERDYEVMREITVPARTSILATSRIVMLDDFESQYDAVGEYSAPGLTAGEIQKLLLEDGIIGVKDDSRGVVIVDIHGSIGGSLACFNEFVINEIIVE